MKEIINTFMLIFPVFIMIISLKTTSWYCDILCFEDNPSFFAKLIYSIPAWLIAFYYTAYCLLYVQKG